MPGWTERWQAGTWPGFEHRGIFLWKTIMQYPWIVSLKCLDHVLEYSFVPKFLWQMVLKQSPVTASPFDNGKEGGKGVMQQWVAHRFGKVHADSEFGKEKKGGSSTSEGVCLLLFRGRTHRPRHCGCRNLNFWGVHVATACMWLLFAFSYFPGEIGESSFVIWRWGGNNVRHQKVPAIFG